MTALRRVLLLHVVLFSLLSLAPAEALARPAGERAACQRTLPSYPVLRPGDRTEAVRTLQCILNDLGLGPVVVDGYYGPQTKQAVWKIARGREGQPPHPLRLTPYFWCQLFGLQLPQRDLEIGDHGHAVANLQRALRAFGIEVVVDGDFGPQTQDAVEQFQREGEMRVTGRVDEGTRYFLAGGFYF